jgi:hypothetical protein
MKRFFCIMLLALSLLTNSFAQQGKPWTEKEKACLLDNLTRTRDALINETKTVHFIF